MTASPPVRPPVPAFAADAFPEWPAWTTAEQNNLIAALGSGAWAGSRARQTRDFAAAFARYHDAAHGVPLSNGTTTLEAALIALGVGEGDEVIVPALTFVATASAVLRVGAVPVIVDVDPGSLCLRADLVDGAVTERTRAVIVVHLAGAAGDIDGLVALCELRSLALVEDCAHAHGSRWRGRGLGSFGAFGSFSFQQSKLMTAGEGGVLVTNDQALAQAAWGYANGGRDAIGTTYHHPSIGTNSRMTEWQGAVLAAQLDRYPQQCATRNANGLALARALTQVPGLTAQTRDERLDSQGYYAFVVHYRSDEFAGMPCETFRDLLSAHGVPVVQPYPSLTTLDVFAQRRFAPTRRSLRDGFTIATAPVAEAVPGTTVWIHHRVLLAERDTVLRLAELCADIRQDAARLTAASS
ncbi:DegT/DnrJ/EryC1/StrS family aminotransferase [Micromonospora craniellae]|uniref:DegT/DnrJ/EryC1/StrS family aminotransferase n=1 Tax=Micromonospora craniellae TaxID=2294034 RepID=A0A372FRR9_9ACTN|nr:DegT/DnrJ/EryC1/StrS family aminotransferase [Micromonospora craniellae]QOC93474.1 DegT/DnrJ/EryC1/StrS family aminotransferase [Micromonospora craniellae]RFS43465.1 DegT/DnrJ/EryC1/StrS family aminotransferase [Micromonospora craniellae]